LSANIIAGVFLVVCGKEKYKRGQKSRAFCGKKKRAALTYLSLLKGENFSAQRKPSICLFLTASSHFPQNYAAEGGEI